MQSIPSEFQRRLSEFDHAVSEAERRFQETPFTLSSLERLPFYEGEGYEVEDCVVPAAIEDAFASALRDAHIRFDRFGLGARASVYGNCKESYRELQGILQNALGISEDIPVSVFRTSFSRDSVLAFCKGFTNPSDQDPFWRAFHDYDRAQSYRARFLTHPDILDADDDSLPDALEAVADKMREEATTMNISNSIIASLKAQSSAARIPSA